MQVVLNGEDSSLPDLDTVAELIEHLDLTGRIAVEINLEIVPRSQFDTFRIHEGDRIEIVHAIGGG